MRVLKKNSPQGGCLNFIKQQNAWIYTNALDVPSPIALSHGESSSLTDCFELELGQLAFELHAAYASATNGAPLENEKAAIYWLQEANNVAPLTHPFFAACSSANDDNRF